MRTLTGAAAAPACPAANAAARRIQATGSQSLGCRPPGSPFYRGDKTLAESLANAAPLVFATDPESVYTQAHIPPSSFQAVVQASSPSAENSSGLCSVNPGSKQ